MVPVSWVMVAEEMYFICSLHVWPFCKTSVCREQSCLIHLLLVVAGLTRVQSNLDKLLLPFVSLLSLCFKIFTLTIHSPVLCNGLTTDVVSNNQRWDVPFFSVKGEKLAGIYFLFDHHIWLFRLLYEVIPEPTCSIFIIRFQLLSSACIY